MWRLHWALLAGIWLILAPGSACSRETITVAAEDDWPPYSSIKADKSGPEGFSSELVRAVFDLTRNPRITLVRATSDAHQLQMLLAGRIEYALLNTMPAYLRINRDPGLRGRIRLAGTLAEDAFWLAFSRRHPDGQRLSVLFEEGLQELRASGRYDIMLRNFRKRVGAD